MSWLDIVIVVSLVVGTFIGLKVGVIKAVLSLVGLVIGIVLAGRLYGPFAQVLGFIPQPDIARILAFAIILIGVMIIAAVVAKLLKWFASVTLLGWVDRLGGAILGLFLGAIAWGAFMAVWAKYLGVTGILAESKAAAILLDRFPMVLALLPGEFDAIRGFFQ